MISELGKKIVVALDVATINEAEEIVIKLKDHVKYFKIGSILFTHYGPECMNMVINSGCELFLDLKYHDIPNTVSLAGLEAAKLGVWMFNLHIVGGEEMMKTTVESVKNFCIENRKRKPLILGVTLLTSINDEILKDSMMVNLNSKEYIKALAIKAKECKLDGVVASPKEVSLVREACGDKFIILTPGIRPLWASKDDQMRLSTPREAVSNGANYLVIGRPIIKAPDPLEAFNKILDELK
jgi:orotidine-5'-phosphate decarboxylase